MSYQKKLPCPNCKNDDNIIVFKYDSGWAHVECVKCDYLGPGEGSIKQAIIEHNKYCRSMPAMTTTAVSPPSRATPEASS